jgi:hypothetical protein
VRATWQVRRVVAMLSADSPTLLDPIGESKAASSESTAASIESKPGGNNNNNSNNIVERGTRLLDMCNVLLIVCDCSAEVVRYYINIQPMLQFVEDVVLKRYLRAVFNHTKTALRNTFTLSAKKLFSKCNEYCKLKQINTTTNDEAIWYCF